MKNDVKRVPYFKITHGNHVDRAYYEQIKADSGIVIGNITMLNDKETRLVVEVFGDTRFDILMDDIMSAILYVCKVTLDANGNKKESKEEIYTRTVQAFSFIMDEFNPEAKNYKKDLAEELKELEKQKE